MKLECVDCGKTIVMSELDYKLRYDGKPTKIRCIECNKKHFKEYLRENPEIRKAFKESVENVMGTPEKREKLANEIVTSWNRLVEELKKRGKIK